MRLAALAALAAVLGGVLWVLWALSALRPLSGSAGGGNLAAALPPAERAAMAAGRVRFLDGLAACRMANRLARGRGRLALQNKEVLVVLNTPAVFRTARAPLGGKSDGERVRLITEAAIRLGARLIVDCTDADLARLTPAGWQSVRAAKQAGLWRMVVFDGAHHLPALAAAPELLLLPLLNAGGQRLIIHGYVRDALPLPVLQRTLRRSGSHPVLVTLPRLSLPLKENLPLGLVVRQALRQVAADGGAGAGTAEATGPLDVSPPRRAPRYGDEAGLPLSVWDILLRFPLALAGWPLPDFGPAAAEPQTDFGPASPRNPPRTAPG